MPLACAVIVACATPAAPHPAGPFTLARGASVLVAPGVSVTFDAVEDSRCPPGVQCVWAGRLSYRFSIRHGDAAPEYFTLSPAQREAAPAALGGRRIVLDADTIPPPPPQGAVIDYRATLSILPSQPAQPT
ncbi:hypothetical protein [Massilia sp. Mn16-1_5]|uniref:hypothetical protein n=1 Tax=Massilia sp. Mn16-1_5 TaxID=2079199 RepID=UPI00109EDCF8|nr:hypothetical protein [Massilia sp. Mn16-1_5]